MNNVFDVMYGRYVLTIAALIVIIMMDVLYFSKPKRSDKFKHKMFSYLIIFNTLILTTEMIIMFGFGLGFPFVANVVFLKLRDLFLMFYFVMVLFYYYSAVNELTYKGHAEFIKGEKNIVRPHLIFTAIVIIIHAILPYKVVDKVTFNYAFAGPAFYLTIGYCVVTTIFTLYIIIFRKKNEIKKNEKISLVWLFVLMLVILIGQTVFNEVAIMGLVSSVYILGLYFLFENPDIEIIEEIDTLTTDIDKANRTKIDFLSKVSKEMIAPMQNIVELSEKIMSDSNYEDSSLPNDVKQIELYSKDFLEIINNTIDISDVESDQETLIDKKYSLIQILRDLAKVSQDKLANKKVKLVLNIDKDIPNNLYGDSNKIYQILLNLVTNSIKFTDVGKISIALSKEIKGNKILLKFRVRDTGIGIKREDFDKLFRKYSRLEDAVSHNIEGTGVGLFIAKNYVDLMGGKIWLDSEYGAGTTFYVEITQQIDAMTPTLESFELVEENDPEKNELLNCSKYRILIVEDDPLNLDVTKRLFARYGFEIDTCDNGKDCIFKYKKGEHYDMILVDHRMQGMTGIEVIQIIRKLKDYKAPPVVALTANVFTGSKDVYLREGFDDYISKPIDMLELDLLINKYFKK